MSPTLKHIRKWKLLSTNDAEAVDLFRSIEKTKKKTVTHSFQEAQLDPHKNKC